jgi:hypothetical protein
LISIAFLLLKEDSEGNWEPAGIVIYDYLQEVLWNDEASLAKLKLWGGNKLRRVLAYSKPRWLEEEMNQLYQIVHDVLGQKMLEAVGRRSSGTNSGKSSRRWFANLLNMAG